METVKAFNKTKTEKTSLGSERYTELQTKFDTILTNTIDLVHNAVVSLGLLQVVAHCWELVRQDLVRMAFLAAVWRADFSPKLLLLPIYNINTKYNKAMLIKNVTN